MDLEVLEDLTVAYRGETRTISLCQGDLANLSDQDAVDLLVISAFPGDYTPTPGSLIGALAQRGLSVADLATRRMAVDLRDSTSCWLSEELGPLDPKLNVRHILCFEPYIKGPPPEGVGDIFRALMAIAAAAKPEDLLHVAMPIVATGNQRFSMLQMMRPLLEAAARWLSLGAPISSLKIVTRPDRAHVAVKAFQDAREAIDVEVREPEGPHGYDAFISYSRRDADAVDRMAEHLRKGGARVFVDRLEIEPGAFWQQKMWDALADCRAVLAVYSPEYLRSKACLEELNIAMLRRRTEDTVVVPVHLRETTLPPQMQILNIIDCREGSDERVDSALPVIERALLGRVLGAGPPPAPSPARPAALSPLPLYVRPDGQWRRACDDWLEARRDRYVEANARKLEAIVREDETGARMLVNLGDYALLRVLEGGRYLNCYEVADLIGTPPTSDGVRERVDALIGFGGPAAAEIHFGAVGLESAGVRFYGAYCLALDRQVAGLAGTQIFERDSYELVFPPLDGASPETDLQRAAALRGTWSVDLEGMAVLKARALLTDSGRLVTEGRFRDVLLRGEEFIEVHFRGDIDLACVSEVRQAPVDVAAEHRLHSAYDRGVLPRLEELVWLARRSTIERRLDAAGKPTRVVEAEVTR